MMFLKWNFTVFMLIERIMEISQVFLPSFAQFKTSVSLEDSSTPNPAAFSLLTPAIRLRAWSRWGTT
jgi:hypothetical protein